MKNTKCWINKVILGDYVLSCKAQSQKREKKLAEPRFSLFLSLQDHYRKIQKFKIIPYSSLLSKNNSNS
ncbi:MAG: hypothetical protein EAZ06_02175 [Cytophagales bacterium]|nr:MAG: hypothetical protein EAZ06_02175 [Cytophagales bacterium]